MTAEIGTIAVIGGTGREGSGLALRWAAARLDVIIGSRQREKAEQAAAEINQRLRWEAVLRRGSGRPDHRAHCALQRSRGDVNGYQRGRARQGVGRRERAATPSQGQSGLVAEGEVGCGGGAGASGTGCASGMRFPERLGGAFAGPRSSR